MPPNLSRWIAPLALCFLLAIATPGIASAASPLAIDGDVIALAGPSEGRSIASISGSIGRSNRGVARLAPSAYARRAGYARGEEALLVRTRNGTLLVLGGLGTRIAIRTHGETFVATGYVATKLRARRTVNVEGHGVVLARRSRPAPGKTVLVRGSPNGPVFEALRKRYRLVRFDPDRHSRAALLANPAAYRQIAGVVTDSSLRATSTEAVSDLRAMFNSGRWVAASPKAATLSKVMYPVFHAHFRGTQGALLRSADAGNGTRARKNLVVVEPRVHWARTRQAQAALKRGTPPPGAMADARKAATRMLARSVARGELVGSRPSKRASSNAGQVLAQVTTAAGTGSCNGAQTSGNTGSTGSSVSGPGAAPAVYEICVSAPVIVVTTASSLLNPWGLTTSGVQCPGALGADSWCATPLATCNTSGGGWAPPGPGWPCGANYGSLSMSSGTYFGCSSCGTNAFMMLLASGYPTTLTQSSSVQFERLYTVSLAALGQGSYQQWVSETDNSQVNAVAVGSTPPVIQDLSGGDEPAVAPQTNPTGSSNVTDWFPTAYYCGLGGGNSCSGFYTGLLQSQEPWPNSWTWEAPQWAGGPATNPQEAGFALGAGLHTAAFDYQPQQGQALAATGMVLSTAATKPQATAAIQNTSGSTESNNSNWDSTVQSSTWSIGGNVDASCEAADCEATGEVSASISGGYSSTTTTSSGSSQSDTYVTAGSQTMANWATTPYVDACSRTSSGSATTISGPCSAWLMNSVWFGENWTGYVPSLGFTGYPAYGTPWLPNCASSGQSCFVPGGTGASSGWGAGQNVTGLTTATVASYSLTPSSQADGVTGGLVPGTVTPRDEDTIYLVNQANPGPLASVQAEVVSVMLSSLGASASVSCSGSCGGITATQQASNGVSAVNSTFTVAGTPVPSGGSQLTMSDLDLCAPPVVTAELWTNGCDTDPSYNSVPPQTWAPIPVCSGTQCSAGGTPLLTAAAPPTGGQYPPYTLPAGSQAVCGPGAWSAAQSYAYQWFQWAAAKGQNAWVPVTTGVSPSSPNTLMPPSNAVGNIYLCQVTATGSGGSTTVYSPSFTVIQ